MKKPPRLMRIWEACLHDGMLESILLASHFAHRCRDCAATATRFKTLFFRGFSPGQRFGLPFATCVEDSTDLVKFRRIHTVTCGLESLSQRVLFLHAFFPEHCIKVPGTGSRSPGWVSRLVATCKKTV
jgi:hypothetical protein